MADAVPGTVAQAARTNRFAGESPLDFLHHPTIVTVKKREFIYSRKSPCPGLCCVASGTVAVSRFPRPDCEVLVDVYGPEDLFGELSLLDQAENEQAIALLDTAVMIWPVRQVVETMAREPRLIRSLLQLELLRAIDLTQRVESFSTEDVVHRLARALIRFSEHLSTPDDSGCREIRPPLTHLLLSNYLGVSRVVVSEKMNELRSLGFVRYSREGTCVYGDAVREWLLQTSGNRAA